MDEQKRVCKTYVDALGPDKGLETVYGGMLGIGALGSKVVKCALFACPHPMFRPPLSLRGSSHIRHLS